MYPSCGLLSYRAPKAVTNAFHLALARGSHGTTITPESGAVSTRNAAPPGLHARIEKVKGFLVVVDLVAAADVWTTVELIRETMVVPAGKYAETITLPTSSVTKLAVDEVSVAASRVVTPSVKVQPPMSHGGASMPAIIPRPINFPLVTAKAKHSSICAQL